MRIILCIILISLSSLVLPLHAYSEEPISSLPRMNQMMGHGLGWYGPKSPGVAALLGYMITKVISAYDATSTAERLMNSEHVSL